MPLVTETDKSRPGKHRWHAAWLLLFPPVLGLALLLAAGVQPLQLGPYVLTSAVVHSPGLGWKCSYVPLATPAVSNPPARRNISIELGGQPYAITGEAHALIFGLRDYGGSLLWFRGRRER